MPMSSGLRYGPHRGLLFLKSNLSPSDSHVRSRSRLQWYPISKIQEPTIAFNAKYEIGLGYLDFCQLNSNYLLWECNCLRYSRVIGAGVEKIEVSAICIGLGEVPMMSFSETSLSVYVCLACHQSSMTFYSTADAKPCHFIQLQHHLTFKVSIVSRAGQRDQIDNFVQLY